LIKKIDDASWDNKIQDIHMKMKMANKDHYDSMKLYSEGRSTKDIFNKIKELNHEAPMAFYNSRTAICVDATGSMSVVFPKVIQVLQNAMPDIYQAI
jgi:urease accessory protein UreH